MYRKLEKSKLYVLKYYKLTSEMQHSHTELEYTTNRNFYLNFKVVYMVFEFYYFLRVRIYSNDVYCTSYPWKCKIVLVILFVKYMHFIMRCSPCLWCAVTNWRNHNDIIAFLSKNIATCAFYLWCTVVDSILSIILSILILILLRYNWLKNDCFTRPKYLLDVC